MTTQGSNDQRNNVYHYPWGSAYCGNISTQPGNQYVPVSGFAPSNPADQMNFEQHQIFPVAPAIQTIDPRFIHPSAMLQHYQQPMPFHHPFVSYGQPANITNQFAMYDPSTLVQPFHFQNYQQPSGQPPQMWNTTYTQTQPMHYNVPTSKFNNPQKNWGLVDENTTNGNITYPVPPQPSFQRPFQNPPKGRDEVLWKAPFYEPHPVHGSTSTSSPLLEEDNDSVPFSTNTSDLSTLREVRNVESPEPPLRTQVQVSNTKEQVKEEVNYQDTENEYEQESHDAISFSSVENMTGTTIMSKKPLCDDREALFESSSENSRAVEYSLLPSRDITSEGRSAIALEPAPLVYLSPIKRPKGSRNKKSIGLDDVSCSQASPGSLTPRSISLSTLWHNDSVDYLTVYTPEYQAPMSQSPHRPTQDIIEQIDPKAKDSTIAGTPAPDAHESCSLETTVTSKSSPVLTSLDQNKPVSGSIRKENVLELDSAVSVEVVNKPEETLTAKEDSSGALLKTKTPTGASSSLSESVSQEAKPLPLILESTVVEAPWQKVGARKNYRQNKIKLCPPQPPKSDNRESHVQEKQECQPNKKSKKSRKKRRRKKNKKASQEQIGAHINVAPPVQVQEMYNQRRKSVCSSLKEHLSHSFFINMWFKKKTN